MGRRCYRWLGPGSLSLRRADGTMALVLPYGAEGAPDDPHSRIASGLICKKENMDALSDRIESFVAAGQMEIVEEYDGPQRRSGQDRRHGERRA